MRVRKTVLAGLVIASLLGLGACGGGGGGDDELTADVRIEDEDVRRFEPDELEIVLNQETTFTFLNDDDLLHNVTIPQLSLDKEQNPIDVDIPIGQRVAVKIPAVAQAPREGFFLFYCKYHQTEGMSGRIKISN